MWSYKRVDTVAQKPTHGILYTKCNKSPVASFRHLWFPSGYDVNNYIIKDTAGDKTDIGLHRCGF